METKYITPCGATYDLYEDALKQPHLLIAGATGSGKSVVINGIIVTSLYNSPNRVKFILIDPKRVELIDYKHIPHTIRYASEPAEMLAALEYAMHLIDMRDKRMQAQRIKKWKGSDIYVVIDELADLMTTQKRAVQPLLQRISQVGRAAKVHLIAATQCPLREIIPTAIKCNIDARIGLRTRSAQDSRNILGVNGCERLPRYGQGYYMTPEGMTLYNIPMIPDEEIKRIVEWWEIQRPVKGWLANKRRDKAIAKLRR